MKAGRLMIKEADRQTDRLVIKEADRQTDRQAD